MNCQKMAGSGSDSFRFFHHRCAAARTAASVLLFVSCSRTRPKPAAAAIATPSFLRPFSSETGLFINVSARYNDPGPSRNRLAQIILALAVKAGLSIVAAMSALGVPSLAGAVAQHSYRNVCVLHVRVAQFSGAIGDELAAEPRLLGALHSGLLRSVD